MLTRTASGINEAPIDDPGYLYLHHERCRSNGVNTSNVRACKGNYKAHNNLELIIIIKKNVFASSQVNSTQ